MEYKINLTRLIRPAFELYEKDYDNLLTVEVYSKGENISEDCQVRLTFSRNGLIGFATELLRYAHEWEKMEITHTHLYPIVPGEDIVQDAGVFLTPESSQVILYFANSEKTAKELAKDLPEKDENHKKTPDAPSEAEIQEMMEVLKQVVPKLGFIPTFKQN